MVDFTQDVINFQKNGTYSYKFDEAGNVVMNPSASIYQNFYLAIPLANVNYDDNKINSFYNTTITEFVTSSLVTTSSGSIDITDKLNSVITQNQELQNRLNSLISQNESNNSSANIQLIKDIILGLRIQLNQGSSSTDFDTTFPYLPLPLDQQTNAPTS